MTDPFSRTAQGASAADPAGDAPGTLTYEPFFGLREKPFALSADPRFLFRSPAHGRALDGLLAGIRRREGLIALTGEIGMGKTTLCRAALRQLNRRTFASFVPDPFLSREDLLTMLLVDFGVTSIDELKQGRLQGASRAQLSYALYDFLDSLVPLQAFAVVVIDEAQNLLAPLLEEIRILSDLERREKLLQVVLVGQPELRANLKRHEMRQVDQRVTVRVQLTPLDAAGVAGYVTHRLSIAGDGAARVEFTPAALEEIYRGSTGVPRLINRICDGALHLAYAGGTHTVDSAIVRAAMQDIGLEVAGLPATAPQQKMAPGARPEPPSTPAAAPAHAAGNAWHGTPGRHLARQWVTATAAAAVVGIAATTGSVGRSSFLQARSIDRGAILAMLPPAPPRPQAGALGPAFPDADAAMLASATHHVVVTPAADAVPEVGEYAIQVGSFASDEHAELLVAALANAGYPARAVEVVPAPPRGRTLRVVVAGYSSAIAVERDLRRIRELPGCEGAQLLER